MKRYLEQEMRELNVVVTKVKEGHYIYKGLNFDIAIKRLYDLVEEVYYLQIDETVSQSVEDYFETRYLFNSLNEAIEAVVEFDKIIESKKGSKYFTDTNKRLYSCDEFEVGEYYISYISGVVRVKEIRDRQGYKPIVAEDKKGDCYFHYCQLKDINKENIEYFINDCKKYNKVEKIQQFKNDLKRLNINIGGF